MKRIFTLFTFAFVIGITGTEAQVQPKGFHLQKPINMAAILAPKSSMVTGFSSISEARTIISDIMDVSDKQQNFTVQSTTQVNNAAAVVYQNTRYILYNPNFINQLDNAANDRWASISVLAHEIGHHLYGHTLDGRGSQIPKELEADEYSGLVLRRMGATLQQSQLAMQLISSPYASATHPAQKDRLAAISRGWNNTTTRAIENRDVAIESPTNSGRTTTPTNNGRTTYPSGGATNYPTTGNARTYPQRDNRSNYPAQRSQQQGRATTQSRRGNNTANQTIIYNIRFNGANGQQYFITSGNNVVQANGNRFQVVAKIGATNNARYPYIIYDDRQQLYVDKRGTIYANNGRSLVGVITPRS
ncbi:MAG: hypothetical protein JWQ96_1046 [Segetibacter sp.]|nr:hypothetical protein [Segetibacter sp.]